MAKNITYEERFTIERMLKANYTLRDIARCICRAYSTIRHEVKRCISEPYSAPVAHKIATESMIRKPKFELCPKTKEFIDKQLRDEKWSPQIISKRLAGENLQVVSHTFIYGYIEKNKKSGGDLYQSLTHPSYGNKREYKGKIENRRSIHERPEVVNQRSRLGDMEIDLIVGPKNQGSSLASGIDRKSRYCVLAKAFNKTKETVANTVVESLSNIGFMLNSITSDNGNEFADHKLISEKLDVDYYFADPYASYQRGSIEQLNGLVRRFFPKGTCIDNLSESEIKLVETKLNNRPRKVLGWLSPVEFLKKQGIDLESARLRV